MPVIQSARKKVLSKQDVNGFETESEKDFGCSGTDESLSEEELDGIEYEKLGQTQLIRNQELPITSEKYYVGHKGSAREAFGEESDENDSNSQSSTNEDSPIEFEHLEKENAPSRKVSSNDVKQPQITTATDRRVDDKAKGQHLQAQLRFWQSLLSIRMEVDKLRQLSNTLPVSFVQETPAECQNLKALQRELLSVQSDFVSKVTQDSRKRPYDSSEDPMSALENQRKRIRSFRATSLNDWNSRLQTAQGLKAFKQVSRTLTEQISSICRDKDRLRKRLRTNRHGVQQFGSDPVPDSTVLDDTDFFHILAQDYLEANPDDPQNVAIDEMLNRPITKAVRKHDRKRIKYDVDPKMEFFMAPMEIKGEWSNERVQLLFGSLFAAS